MLGLKFIHGTPGGWCISWPIKMICTPFELCYNVRRLLLAGRKPRISPVTAEDSAFLPWPSKLGYNCVCCWIWLYYIVLISASQYVNCTKDIFGHPVFNSLALGCVVVMLNCNLSKYVTDPCYSPWAFCVKLLSGKCRGTHLMVSRNSARK